jgi:hypothetical protein
MIGKMLKMYAYTKAPKATFALRHPRTTAQLAHARYDLKHSWATRATAVGAALIALPLGYLVGRMTRRPQRAWQPPPEREDLGTGL